MDTIIVGIWSCDDHSLCGSACRDAQLSSHRHQRHLTTHNLRAAAPSLTSFFDHAIDAVQHRIEEASNREDATCNGAEACQEAGVGAAALSDFGHDG